MEIKFLFLNLAPPVFLIGFFFFSRVVSRRLPVERLFSWRLFCVGGFVAIVGLSIAVYFMQVEEGAAVVMVGAIVAAIGLGKFFVSH